MRWSKAVFVYVHSAGIPGNFDRKTEPVQSSARSIEIFGLNLSLCDGVVVYLWHLTATAPTGTSQLLAARLH